MIDYYTFVRRHVRELKNYFNDVCVNSESQIARVSLPLQI